MKRHVAITWKQTAQTARDATKDKYVRTLETNQRKKPRGVLFAHTRTEPMNGSRYWDSVVAQSMPADKLSLVAFPRPIVKGGGSCPLMLSPIGSLLLALFRGELALFERCLSVI